MTDDWLKDIDQQNIVGAVLLDLSAAFDVIDHSLLLKKLKCYGFTPSAVAWIECYLTNRTQKVFFNGSLSNARHIQCGNPQGSSLGPLLFLIFKNYLLCVYVCRWFNTICLHKQLMKSHQPSAKSCRWYSNGSLITSLSWTYLKPRALFLEQNTH